MARACRGVPSACLCHARRSATSELKPAASVASSAPAASARGRALQTGNTKSNLCEEYPGAAFVEYHVPAADPQGAGPTWASLRLVFEATPGGVRLVGIVHDQWTI